jgi:hypothetical protein
VIHQLPIHVPPIHTLPNELIAEILLIGTYDMVPERTNNLAQPRPSFPIQAAGVCARWRDLALSLPIIWSSIRMDIEVFEEMREPSRNIIRLRMDLFLSRSLDYPLDIALWMSPQITTSQTGFEGRFFLTDEIFKYELSFQLIETLFSYAHRWRSAILDFGDSLGKRTKDTGRVLNIPWPDSFPLLTSLKISLDNADFSKDEEFLSLFRDPRMFTRAPLLERIEIDSAAGSLLQFPFSQAKNVKIQAFDASEALRLLSSLQYSPSLDTLRLFFVNDSTLAGPMDAITSSAVAISCRSLSLRFDNSQMLEEEHSDDDESYILLSHLRVKNMQHLRLEDDIYQWSAGQVQKLKDAMSMSLPSLMFLEVVGSVFKEGDLIAFLSLVPLLQHLCITELVPEGETLVYGMTGTALLKALTVEAQNANPSAREPRKALVPQLKIISFGTVAHDPSFEKTFVSMVRSRLPLGCGVTAAERTCEALKEVYWKAANMHIADQTVLQLKELMAPGLHMQVRGPGMTVLVR